MPSTNNNSIPQIKKASTLGNSDRGYQGAYTDRGDVPEAGVPLSFTVREADALSRVARDRVPARASSLDTCHQVGKSSTSVYSTEVSREAFRAALVVSLKACGRDGEAESVAQCGQQFKTGRCRDCGAYPAFPTSCKQRLCPDCAARRGAVLVSEHEGILKQLKYPRMLTLTFPSVAYLDKAYIRWARNCFTKLRHRKVFASCWGGIYSFETTYTYGVGWHLHIHALIGSGFIKQAELSREWAKISGAPVVDIRAIRGKSKWAAVKEVIKYPAKAATFVNDSALVNEFLEATHGVNLAYGFGALYRVRTKERGSLPLVCPVCGSSNIQWLGLVDYCAVTKLPHGYVWRGPATVVADG